MTLSLPLTGARRVGLRMGIPVDLRLNPRVDARGRVNLRNSASQTRQSHRRAPDGQFVERYWSPVNIPILAGDGSVAFIVHRVQDVTDLVELRRVGREHQHAAAVLRTQVEQMEADLFTRGRELQDANLELQRSTPSSPPPVPSCAPTRTPRTSSSPASPTSCATRSLPPALPSTFSAWMCQTIRPVLCSTGN